MKNVFIIGSKGIPAKYGGFETFVEKLTENKKSEKVKYHVSCMEKNYEEFEHNDARCFNIKVPEIGAAKAVYYDILALHKCIKYIEDNNIKDPIIYILACRIGPFVAFFKRKLKKNGIQLFVNPDGHEWKRAKWNAVIRCYWKISERLMVKHADLLICDSLNIEKYIKEDYKKYNPKTTYIAYGAEMQKSSLDNDDKKLINWYEEKQIRKNQYYLIVGRFVPENNYELVIKEYMQSSTDKDLVIITNIEGNKFYDDLLIKTKFNNDSRIKFVGTVYDQELLKKIRENAYGYIHGHEVGGTNPSLLEALAITDLNLLLEVGFNKEVGNDGAIYFSKEEGELAKLIKYTDDLAKNKVKELGDKAKEIINSRYTWEIIVNKYEELFEQ